MLARMPGASQHRRGDLRWIDAGVAEPVFNGVYAGRDVRGGMVDHVIDHFRAHARPFHWELGLRGEAAGAADVLTGRGPQPDGAEPAMGLDLARLPQPPPTVAALVIDPVNT